MGYRCFAKAYKVLLAILVVSLIIAVPVFAQTYYANLFVAETGGTAYTMIGLRQQINVTNLVSSNFITSTGLDTRVMEGTSALNHMLADDKVIFANDLPANTSMTLLFTVGNSALADFPVILGVGGETLIYDAGNLELKDVFQLDMLAYFDASVLDDIIYKQDSFRIYFVSAGNVRATMLGGGDAENLVVNSAMASGIHHIRVLADKTNFEIYVDDMVTPEHTVPLAGNAVPDTVNDFYVGQGDCIIHMDYLKIECVP